ncbi:MAG: NAD(+) synthase [Clostridiales bacterium]|nr:MAG: NAD(+) synthase [Clostridiales bacterium]
MNTKNKIDFIAEFMYNYVKNASAKGLIVGLSGGIDSSVAAAIMKIAFPDNSLGIILPIKSQKIDEELAVKLSKKINIDTVTLDLTSVHQKILNDVTKKLAISENIKIHDANLRARLRMSAIYLIGGIQNYLVVGTDNKDELYTGYFTKYGDGACDLMPLASLLKGEVYEIARYLDLPREIIERPPSAGLWENQTDEKEMGITYAELDAYLKGESINKISIDIIEKLHKVTEHKRNTPIKCPEIK